MSDFIPDGRRFDIFGGIFKQVKKIPEKQRNDIGSQILSETLNIPEFFGSLPLEKKQEFAACVDKARAEGKL